MQFPSGSIPLDGQILDLSICIVQGLDDGISQLGHDVGVGLVEIGVVCEHAQEIVQRHEAKVGVWTGHLVQQTLEGKIGRGRHDEVGWCVWRGSVVKAAAAWGGSWEPEKRVSMVSVDVVRAVMDLVDEGGCVFVERWNAAR